MDKLKKHIYNESNGLHYTLAGDYYIPDLKLPEENRPIGRYGRLHREYLKPSLRSNTALIMATAISCWPGDVLSIY